MSVAKGEKQGLTARAKRQYRGVTGELKKVHWPNRKVLTAYTSVVLASVVIISAVIFVIDSGVGYLMGLIIR